jgi:Flp pilus assembly protein protease CpaA
MDQILTTASPFMLLILLAGIIASVTDIKYRKIGNNIIIFFACIGAAFYIYDYISHGSVPSLQLISLAVAMIVGALFYYHGLWRGGDAKMFMLYSFLMPSTVGSGATFLPCISLLCNAFIIGTIFLVPEVLLRCMESKQNLLIKIYVYNRYQLKGFSGRLLKPLCVSWIIFPLLAGVRSSFHSPLSFLTFFGAMLLVHRIGRRVLLNPAVFLPILIIGLVLRIWLQPEFFTLKTMSLSFLTIVVYFVLSANLFYFTRKIFNAKDRMPFAPFLLGGCVLSYTPFIALLIKLSHTRFLSY